MEASLHEFINKTFDVIVVGGGTAGLVVASRLAANPVLTVGIIEAGEAHLGDGCVDFPAGVGKMLSNPAYDYQFFSSPQVGCLAPILQTAY